ncbi:sigma-54-dependent Fis family transcriptional regulator, partial [Candidatus Dependentiae bacterium]|nr:sigma-54-dependent Fis family transcriptional regulator [Candidatus Dependentiae bacterium]
MEKIILVIDDVKEIGKTIEMLMEGKDCKIIKKYNGLSGIQAINEKVDLIISDIKMPGVDGFEVLKYAKEKFLGIPVIIITGFGDIAIAVKAIKNGAYDFITKPFHIDEIENKINRALNVNWREQSNKENKNQTLIIGKNEKIIKILDFIDTIHDTDSIVIIYGESGTGKELIAKRIHESSRRKNENFVAVNCAAIPFDLLESELFGYEKGAFTGANTLKQGLFEIADNGTIFLDEIGD